jgi:hypothetical protein
MGAEVKRPMSADRAAWVEAAWARVGASPDDFWDAKVAALDAYSRAAGVGDLTVFGLLTGIDVTLPPLTNDTPPPRFVPPADQLAPERPPRAEGDLAPDDLAPGLVVLWHSPVGASRHRVVAAPEDGWVRMAHLSDLGESPSPAWLADMGMAPYPNGTWRTICRVTADGEGEGDAR